MKINWREEVDKRKDMLISDLQELLQIRSVLDEGTASVEAPFGEEVNRALTYLLEKGEADGFITKNVDGFAGHIEMGGGEELIGVLGHIDVVPEGDGWSSNPYGAEIRDGKIYARGAIDDKGPTMAAYYGMKIVKELGLPLTKRVRVIIGADEESGMRCMKHYFQNEEMVTMGFAPDADFPIIYAEKGMWNLTLAQKNSGSETPILLEFDAGRRLNMVPDFATAVIVSEQTEAVAQFNEFLMREQLTGKCYIENGRTYFELVGVSGHGSVPETGRNAGLLLAKFLRQVNLDEQGAEFTRFADEILADTTGGGLKIDCQDEVSGQLTVNIGTMSYSATLGGNFGANIRYPVTAEPEQFIGKIEDVCASSGFYVKEKRHAKAHYVDKNHQLITSLQKVYQEQTGDEATLLAIGGGTYARMLDVGVAFGALFPGEEELAHQKDEYIAIESLLKATAIYAAAIFELAQ